MQRADSPVEATEGDSQQQAGVRARQDGTAENKAEERLSRLGQAVTHALTQKKLRDAKRVVDGTAASTHAAEAGGRAPMLAELGWKQVEKILKRST